MANIAWHVRQIVDSAPELTPEQRINLRAILMPHATDDDWHSRQLEAARQVERVTEAPTDPTFIRRRDEPSQYVYFIHATESGYIKIGTSRQPVQRLASLQTGSPEHLELLGAIPGGERVEGEWHRRFDADRARGEWFAPSPCLVAAIQDALSSGPNQQQRESAAKAAEARHELRRMRGATA